MGEGMERGEVRQSPAPGRQHIASQVHATALWIPYLQIKLAYQRTVEAVSRSKGTEDRARGGVEGNLNSSFAI
jgi:hypothetical protein